MPPRTSNSFSSRLAASSIRRRDEQAPPRARPVVAQREVLGEVEVQHEAAPVAVLGDVADAGLARAARVGAGDRLAADADVARRDVPQAGDRLDELALAVAVDARERDDLAARAPAGRRRRRRAGRDRRARAGRRPRARPRRGLASSFSTRSTTSRPTIMRASIGSSAPAVSIVPTLLPRRSTVTRSATFSTSGSLWEMKTMDVPPCLQARRSTLMSSRGLLRGEHRRRLVEHEHAGAAVERAEDLHALLLADGDVLDARVRVDPRGRSARRARGCAPGPPRRRGARCAAARRRARGSRPPS